MEEQPQVEEEPIQEELQHVYQQFEQELKQLPQVEEGPLHVS
jgi:hypothetical protein